MALFGKKSTSAKATADKKKQETTATSVTSFAPAKNVLLHPRISEKASYMSEKQNAYTFDIPFNATKGAVRSAIISIYKVVPLRVSIVRTPAKAVFSRGKYGMSNRSKKAYVYLKKGDKIEVI